MRKFVGPVIAAALAITSPSVAAAQPAAAAQPDQAAKLAEARAIIATMFPADQREAMFTQLQRELVKQFSAMMPAAFHTDPGLKAIFDSFKDEALEQQRGVMLKHLPLQMEAMADAYSRAFSLSELKDIHAFAMTPSGSHYLSKSLSMVSDPAVSKANSDAIAETNAVTQALLPGFKEKAMTYLNAHPEVAKKLESEVK